MKFWLKTGSVILALWLVAAAIIYYVRQQRPTAARLTAYLQGQDIGGLAGEARARRIKRAEEMLNGLPLEERQEMDRSGVTRGFFRELTPDEQGAFLDATLPTGFKQLMESFNKMDPAARKKIVDRALEQMKERQGEGRPPGGNEQIGQRVVTEGMKSFYRDANADVKLDFAPLLEQIQTNLQQPHP